MVLFKIEAEMAANIDSLMSGWPKKPELLVSIASAAIAIIALGVSIRSCDVAQDANDLAKRIYAQERQLVLVGSFGKKGDEIFVAPLDRSKKLLEGFAFFPNGVHAEAVPIDGDGRFRQTGTIIFELKQISKMYIPSKKGYIQISEGKIPMILKSFYATKGQNYEDVSLYALDIYIKISEEAHEERSIKFQNLLFMQRMSPEEIIDRNFLNEIWKAGGMHIRPGGP